MKQREAVFNAVTNVMGEQEGAYTPSTEERAQIISIVTEGLVAGDVAFSDKAKAKYDTPEKVKTYASGLVSNWLRKDENLNGGVKYQPKNPGSRTGSQDEEVKNLKLLLKSGQLDEAGTEMVQARIDSRIKEIKAAKAKVEINFDSIPADLLDSLNIEH